MSRFKIESENRRTGITTVVNWEQDYKVTATYCRKDGTVIKVETLGYAMNEDTVVRMAAEVNLP